MLNPDMVVGSSGGVNEVVRTFWWSLWSLESVEVIYTGRGIVVYLHHVVFVVFYTLISSKFLYKTSVFAARSFCLCSSDSN
jgi:hypothetical protein